MKATKKLKTKKPLKFQLNENLKNNQVNQKYEEFQDEDQITRRWAQPRDLISPRKSYNFAN